MRTRFIASLIVAATVATASMQVSADDHDNRDNHHYVQHNEWKKGTRIRDEDWSRGDHVNYKDEHLRAPPHGYEWRLVDGNYVLAAVATGVIASVIAASAAGH